MKYKAGDEVLVKAKIAEFDLNRMMYLCELQEEDCLIRFYCPKDFIADKTYESGWLDAWDLAKKIVMGVEDGGFDSQEVIDVFGKNRYYSFKDLTAEEALAKIEAYEREKEIKVGDIVTIESVKGMAVVTNVGEGSVNVMWDDGIAGNCETYRLKKTGKHIDIESLLQQIGE